VRKDYDDGEDILGVGKIEQKKPVAKKTKTYSVPVSSRRGKKEPAKWSPMDLGGEFSSRVSQRFPTYLGQANAVVCAKVFGRLMKTKGIPPTEILAAMDLFFDDDRNFNDIGAGIPLWLKFIRSFPYIQEQAKRTVENDTFDWEEEANSV
jgi:hypothetical protein